MKPAKTVKELMIPIGAYPTIHGDATLLDAILLLEESQEQKQDEAHPYRAVLVVNDRGDVVGKVGHRGFLQALEPKYEMIDDLDKLTRAGLSPDFISHMAENLRLWEDDLASLGKRAGTLKVKDVMHPVAENIDEDASLIDAIHSLVMWGTLSTLVTGDGKVVGILRLSDLYEEVARVIKGSCSKE
jgi:CBS domain-containing protein